MNGQDLDAVSKVTNYMMLKHKTAPKFNFEQAETGEWTVDIKFNNVTYEAVARSKSLAKLLVCKKIEFYQQLDLVMPETLAELHEFFHNVQDQMIFHITPERALWRIRASSETTAKFATYVTQRTRIPDSIIYVTAYLHGRMTKDEFYSKKHISE